MSSRYQLWRLENMLRPGEMSGEFDRLFVPQLGYTTGDIDIHDVSIDGEGRPFFKSTLFNCIATISDRYSFRPLWRPPFISKLAAEDRCHLNGMAMQDGKPKCATACSRSDVVDGRRDRRANGGVLIDYESGEIVADGFSMPHSPRLYQDKLWMLDSGNGSFCHIDLKTGEFQHVTFCPGYARGLCFVGGHAIVGPSRLRHDEQSFHGLLLDEELARCDADARCGLQVIDLRSGDVVPELACVRFRRTQCERLRSSADMGEPTPFPVLLLQNVFRGGGQESLHRVLQSYSLRLPFHYVIIYLRERRLRRRCCLNHPATYPMTSFEALVMVPFPSRLFAHLTRLP